MSIQDSYLHLVESIERRLRADLPVGDSGDLAASIERALSVEARVGELTLAWWRLVAVSISLASALALLVGASITTTARLSVVAPILLWGAWSIVLALGLRRGWYRLWLRYVVPAIDALSIALVIGALSHAMASETAGSSLVFGTALCGYLALSGALRFSRSSAQLSIALAATVFAILATLAHTPLALSLATLALLIVAGILGGRAPSFVRRVVTNEIARAAMTQRYEEARQAVEAREQVLKIVSHDLRNPLHTIAMSTELLLEGGGSEDQRRRQIAIVRRAGERMNRLVKDLLDVAKLESGRLSIQARPTAVPPILSEALDMLRPLASEKSLSLEMEVADGLPCVEADAGRIVQLLSNLVGNAVKFTPAGGRVVMRARGAGPVVQLSVADTGPGIPADQLPHIFGRFWQADPSDRRGIGLGLTISKAIVEAHGGRIWAESRLGEGTTFHFTLSTSAVSPAQPATRTVNR